MNKEADIKAILETISNTHYKDMNNAAVLLGYGFQLTGWIAFSGEAVAEAKELLHNARRKAYVNLVASREAQGSKVGAMMMKEYAMDMCARESAYLTLCERCNSAATHAADLVRSALSYLKTEMATSTNY